VDQVIAGVFASLDQGMSDGVPVVFGEKKRKSKKGIIDFLFLPDINWVCNRGCI
jgi:hypothetical protein